MEGITLFSGLWFVLVAVLIAGYFILDGFDLGAGVLYPFIAKTKTEKAIVRRSIGPVWDGNEVWLITAGGALFAAFPPAYATTFSGFYLAVMLVLFGLIVRAVSLEYRVHDDKWGGAWNACFFIGSLLPALLFGVAIGNVFAGIPMNSNGDYTGIPLLGLVTPFTLATGVLGLLMFMSAGATWIAQKAPKPSDIQARAAKLRIPLQIITLVVFLAVTVLALFVVNPPMMAELAIVRYALAALFLVVLIAAIFFGKKGNDLWAFLTQSASAFVLVLLFAASMFPNFVNATEGTAITIANAANSEYTLMWMTIITCIGLPLVLFYHFIIYRTFRGRLGDEDLDY